ncbi:GNAT family N-acetyltransferase [Flavobacterium sp.]|uniref:GNAT family N-acetyltransferase n=1 Tax=Flavobacterium sp. TaxID=239 RepID=UPI003750CDFB
MIISEVKTEQLFIIQDLAYKIWPSTYGEILSKIQLDYMLDKFYNLNYLQNQLENGQNFILISNENVIVGFASYEFNFEKSNKTKIHKIYVLPEIQRKGVGKILMDFIKNKAVENTNLGLLLNVNRFNKAITFYEKYGFTNVSLIDIEIGNGYLMQDYVMELNL